MTLPKPEHVTDCCGAKVQQHQDDGGAHEGTCRDCDETICTACAGLWEDDYSLEGDPGSYRWCGLSLCKSCHSDREYKRERREQRNDSGAAIHTHGDGVARCYCGDSRYQATPSEQRAYVANRVAALDATRIAAKECRHCGGPLPCWSPFGDERPGIRNA